jgi:hypothetical protein
MMLLHGCAILVRAQVVLRQSSCQRQRWRTVSRLLSFLLAGAFALGASTGLNRADDVQPETVGGWGDPNRLEITGAVQLERRLILGAIRGDVDIQFSARPNASLVDYLDTLQRRTALLYHDKGFPEARVECVSDRSQGKICVRINEGTRYCCGAIRVEGADRIPVEDLIRRLGGPCPPANALISSIDHLNGRVIVHWVDKSGNVVDPDDPVWRKGNEACFSEAAEAGDKDQITRCLSDLGFPAAKFDIEIRPDATEKTADLVIRLTNEGPGPTIHEVQVVGNHTSSTQSIIECAGIRVGESYSGDTAAEWQQRLWRTGRFVHCNISPTPCEVDKLRLTVHVDVTELKGAPPIDAKLSPEEAALLKCRDWLAEFPKRNDDVVLTVPTAGCCTARLLITRRGGALVLDDAKPDAHASPRMRYAVVFASDRIGCYSIEKRTKYVLSTGAKTHAVCQCELCIDDDEEQQTRFQAGIGGRSSSDYSTAAEAMLTFGGAPAAFLKVAHSRDKKLAIAGGKLRVQKDDGDLFQVDVKSGELRMTMIPASDGSTAGLEFQRGAYERTCRQIDMLAASFPNTFDQRRPITSALATIADLDLWRSFHGSAELEPRAFSAVHKLLASGALQPLDEAMIDPLAGKVSFVPVWAYSNRGLNELIALFLLPTSDSLFARDTWPWSLCRAMAFALARGKVGAEQLESLVGSSKSGPLCHLCTAALIKTVGWNGAEAVAKIGRTRLTLDDFRNDYRPLLDHRRLLGRELFAIAGALRTLNADEVDALCGGLPPDVAKCFRTAAAELRASPDEPLDKLLPQVLDHCWENGLKARVESALEELAKD